MSGIKRRIAGQLGVKKSTIHLWVSNNSHRGLSNNSTVFNLLEGDCLELLHKIPDKSVASKNRKAGGLARCPTANLQSFGFYSQSIETR